MRDKHALKRPSEYALQKHSCRGSIDEEKEPSGTAWTKPRRHASQPPEYSIEAMLELEHVKCKIGENERRTRAMEKHHL